VHDPEYRGRGDQRVTLTRERVLQAPGDIVASWMDAAGYSEVPNVRADSGWNDGHDIMGRIV
jgi:hypothetical protein